MPIYLSVFLFLVIINLQVVWATSETFPLPPLSSITRNVELQKNDRLVGSFTITNLQTWQNGWGDTQSYLVSVTILDPKGQVVLSYTRTKGDSFDYTAFYSGVYTIQFSVGIEYLPPSGIENPRATLNYNIITSSQSTQPPSQSSSSLSGNLPIWIILTIIVGIVIFAITIIAYLETRSKGKIKPL